MMAKPAQGRTATTRNPMWSYPPLRLEPKPQGRPQVLPLVRPRPAPPDPGDRPVPVLRGGRLRVVQVGVGAARQFGVIPVAAPLERVAVHVVQPPRVRRVAADLRRLPDRRPLLRPVVRHALEVRLPGAQPVPERRRGRRPRPTGVLPLSLGRQPELPPLRQRTVLLAEFGELGAERLGLGEGHVPHRQVVVLGQLRRRLPRQPAHHPLPLPLRRLVLGRPEPLGQRHLDLLLVRPVVRLGLGAAHPERPGRAPAQLDPGDLLLRPGLVRGTHEGDERQHGEE